MTFGDLAFLALALVVCSACAWIGWRAGYDTANRRAGYTISTLRRSLKQSQMETETANERAAFIAREAARRNPPPITEPAYFRDAG